MTEIQHFEASELDTFLYSMIETGGFNDLYFSTGYRVIARRSGEVMPVSQNAMDTYSVELIIKRLFGDSALGRLASGGDDDGDYSIADPKERGKRFYFRTNAQAIQALGGGRGVSICIRAIDQVPPSLDVLNMEEEVTNNFFPTSGIVLIGGPTGSGKSTSQASLMTEHMSNRQKNKVIQTIESPVEYRYDHLEHANNVIFQSSVGEFKADLKSFAQGVRGTLRRGTDGTIVGEMRDLETIEAALIAANTGQTVWGTVHCNSIAQMPERMIKVFPHEVRSQIRYDFYSNLRLAMHQSLFLSPHPEHKRVVVREYLVVTQKMREALIDCPLEKEKQLFKQFMTEHGKTALMDATAKYEQGLLYEEDLNHVATGA